MRPSVTGGYLAFAACVLSAAVAEAQPKGTPPGGGPSGSNSQFTLRREQPGGADGQAARARARAGDCAGALPLFDSALRNTIEPTLRRDRGLCHENLGNPYPAIDDYRAYLIARPDAADADQIRERLSALEEQTGTGAPSSESIQEGAAEGEYGQYSGSANVSVGGHGARASAKSSSKILGPKAGEQSEGYDYYAEQEKLADAAQKSPLRYGTGVVLGPFVHLPRFFIGDGASSDMAYSVGAALRYSTGSTLSVIGEIGYAGIGRGGATSAASGPLLMAGVELRFPISHLASDHLLLRGGLGYEHYVVSGTRAAFNELLGRFAFGYRHVFGPSLGLEVLADGGPVAAIPQNGDTRFLGVIGASVAFLVGF